MKPVYIINSKSGEAILRYSSVLPLGVLNESQLLGSLQRLMHVDKGLNGFTIAYETEEGNWQEITKDGAFDMSEEDRIKKILPLINSMSSLSGNIINGKGELNLIDPTTTQLIREIGFISLQTSFLMNQLGFIDTTLLIGLGDNEQN